MKKKLQNLRKFAIILILTGIVFSSVFIYGELLKPDNIFVTGDPDVSLNGMTLEEYLDSTPATSLTTEEIDGLRYMREEEKLAYDVYIAMYATWGVKIFNKIKDSELSHIDATILLLDKYNITDYASNQSGIFHNPTLQALYTSLIASGNKSVVEALKVGTAIEEIDILDLVKYLQETDKDDFKVVYNMLLLGSRNHLRSFVNQLSNNGVTHKPEYLSQSDYDAIISGNKETGNSAGSTSTYDYTYLYLGIITLFVGIIVYFQSKVKLSDNNVKKVEEELDLSKENTKIRDTNESQDN
jgi:hypothetical protein